MTLPSGSSEGSQAMIQNNAATIAPVADHRRPGLVLASELNS